jgi:hypothetical protein
MTEAQEAKIDRLIADLNDVKVNVAVVLNNQERHEEKIKDLDVTAKDYEANKNKGKGIVWVLGFVWLGVTGAISFLISYFTKQ